MKINPAVDPSPLRAFRAYLMTGLGGATFAAVKCQGVTADTPPPSPTPDPIGSLLAVALTRDAWNAEHPAWNADTQAPTDRCPAATGLPLHDVAGCPDNLDGVHRCDRNPRHQPAVISRAPSPPATGAHRCRCGTRWESALDATTDDTWRAGADAALRAVLLRSSSNYTHAAVRLAADALGVDL